MSYSFYKAYQDSLYAPQDENWIKSQQDFVNRGFDNASDVYTIEEETSFASREYQDIVVRLARVVEPTTGITRSDDYKKIIFKDFDKSVRLGAIFRFENNYWIVTSTTSIGTVPTVVNVRRANNTLRWIDENGGKHSYPCVIDDGIKENRNYMTSGSKFVNPSGILSIRTQLNPNTNLIVPDTRFLFGNLENWVSYELFGGGIENFLNYETEYVGVGGLLRLTLGVTQLNLELDNLTDGYANEYLNTYSLSVSIGSITGSPADTYQMEATIELDDEIVQRNVTWSSDDEAIATVSSSGLITMISSGSAVITCQLENNSSVYDTVTVSVGATPIDESVIVITPNSNAILEGLSQDYNVVQKTNGVSTGETFTFSVVPGGVPSDKYTLTVIDGNNFRVENDGMYLDSLLTIRSTGTTLVKDFEIALRGAW